MKKRIVGLVVLLAMFLVSSIGASFAMSDGAVSQGNISVFKNGKLSKRISGINPVEDGSMLICNGKCMIKSSGVSILAEDQAELAIANNDGFFNLFVRQGHVEFIISEGAAKMAFHTQDGVYCVADIMFNASTESVVRGYMQADDSGTKVGVREGRMIFATADGAKSVKADEYIVLAMSDVKKKAVVPVADRGAAVVTPAAEPVSGTILGMSTGAVIATGVVATAIVVGVGVTVGDSNGDGGGSTVSTSQ